MGGRLTHVALHPHVKHLAILPRDSYLSSLLIKHYHEKVYHQGRAMTMNEFRANELRAYGFSDVARQCHHTFTSALGAGS